MSYQLRPKEVMIQFAEKMFRPYQNRLELYDYQKKFILDEETFRIVNKARQLGFSFAIALEGILESFFYPNYCVLYVSTGEDAAKRILQYCYDLIYSLPKDSSAKLLVASTSEIKFQNGSKLISLPNNPATIRGFRADRVYIDETAHFINDKEIFKAIQPSISRGGKLTLISTPNGRANIFFEKWDEDPHYSKHVIDWTMCPDKVYQKRVRDLRKTMDEIAFNQEYCASFQSDEMALFPPEIVKPCVDIDIVPQKHTSIRFRVMGLDLARINDSTVITIADYNKNETAVITKIEELRKIDFDSQVERVKYLWAEHRVDKINVDATGVGMGTGERLQNMLGSIVEPIVFTNERKELLVTNLRNLFDTRRIKIPDNEKLLRQLYSLEKTHTPTGMIKYKHAGTSHDDFVWSLALSVVDMFQPPAEVKVNYGFEAVSMKVNNDLFGKDEQEREPYGLW